MPVYVPLGYGCAVSFALRSLGVREQAFPFDWVVTGARGMIQCLRDDFQDFLQQPVRADRHQPNSAIVDAYGFEFRHDFPTVERDVACSLDGEYEYSETPIVDGWRDSLPIVREKYQRRIQRFRYVLATSPSVVFVRVGDTTDEDVDTIKSIITARYPTLNYRLLIVNAAATSSVVVSEASSDEDWRRHLKI